METTVHSIVIVVKKTSEKNNNLNVPLIINSFLQESSNCGATRASLKLESHHSYYSLGENCQYRSLIEENWLDFGSVKI